MVNRKLIRIIILFFIFFIFCLLIPQLSFAQNDTITIPIIKALPKLPCVFQDNNTCGDPEAVKGLDDFFLWLYNFGFWVVGIALFVALLWAGINYFLAGPNIGKVKQAKDMLTNVLLGFILLLSAWLILNTINPDLIKSAFKLKPLGQQIVGVPGSEPQPPSVVEPIEETPTGPNCSVIKACFQYQEEGSCNANTCSVGNAGCKWRNNECVDSELECSTIEACFQYDESDCNADSCKVNKPDGCEWKNNECVDAPANGNGEGCPEGATKLGGARNGAEFCDDFSFSHSGGQLIIYCTTGGEATSFVAGTPPRTCPADSPKAGETIPKTSPWKVDRCTNISSYCYNDSQASFDTSILNKKQEQKCTKKDDSFTINLSAGDYFAGSHGPGVSETLACEPQ